MDEVTKWFNKAEELQNQVGALRAENEKLKEELIELAKLAVEMQATNVELVGKYESIVTAATKVALCFPDKIPEGQEEIQFNIPAYIIEQMKQTLKDIKKG